MTDGVAGLVGVGDVRVFITNGGAHPSEKWAVMLTNRILSIADTAPPVIRDQAIAFRAQVGGMAALYIKQAREDMRAHMATVLERDGFAVAAEHLRQQEIT